MILGKNSRGGQLAAPFFDEYFSLLIDSEFSAPSALSAVNNHFKPRSFQI